MKILVSFGSQGYESGLERLRQSANQYFDKVILYREDDIRAFVQSNPHLYHNGNRGFGWWAWKPYIIMSTLDNHQGATVMYTDALCEFITDPEPLFSNAPMTLFDQSVSGYKECHYTKQDVLLYYSLLGGGDRDQYHLTASFQIYNDSQQALRFLQDYYHGCTNLHLVSDSCIQNSGSDFRAHRHDQSILGMLSQIYTPFVIRKQDPSQWGIINQEAMEKRGYRQIINHHRTK